MSSQLLSTPSTHRWSLSGLADTVLNGVKEFIFQSSWSPLAKIAESAVVLYVPFFALLISRSAVTVSLWPDPPCHHIMRRMLIILLHMLQHVVPYH